MGLYIDGVRVKIDYCEVVFTLTPFIEFIDYGSPSMFIYISAITPITLM